MFRLSLYQQRTMLNYQNAKSLLTKGFKRSVYWNKYKIIPIKTFDGDDNIRELPKSSYHGVKRLVSLAYRDQDGANRVTANSRRRYFLPRVKIANYNIEIDGRNFYDQPINDSIKQYEKSEKYQHDKVMITQQDGCQILLILKKITY